MGSDTSMWFASTATAVLINKFLKRSDTMQLLKFFFPFLFLTTVCIVQSRLLWGFIPVNALACIGASNGLDVF